MAKGDDGHWMEKAFANSHGQFSDKAKNAGESTSQFASSHKGDSGKLGAQARLAAIGMKYGGGGGHKKGSAKAQAHALRKS